MAIGVLMLCGKEINLTTIAAILTIIGFSVNDTVVVYDRVRENMGRRRGMSFPDLIDLSVSEMLGRTVLTSATAILSLSAFLVWGTGAIKEFAFTLIVGMLSGVYSTVWIALPLTHWLDKLMTRRAPDPPSRKTKPGLDARVGRGGAASLPSPLKTRIRGRSDRSSDPGLG